VLGAAGVTRAAVILFFISNEGISILENAVRIGLPIPRKLKEVLLQIGKKSEEGEGE
jgi:toxin secretion/phage lysis holin